VFSAVPGRLIEEFGELSQLSAPRSPIIVGYADGVEGMETLVSGDDDDDDDSDDDDDESDGAEPGNCGESIAPFSSMASMTDYADVDSLKPNPRKGRRGTVESTELRVSKDGSGKKTVNQ
jgi:hypothetical protein